MTEYFIYTTLASIKLWGKREVRDGRGMAIHGLLQTFPRTNADLSCVVSVRARSGSIKDKWPTWPGLESPLNWKRYHNIKTRSMSIWEGHDQITAFLLRTRITLNFPVHDHLIAAHQAFCINVKIHVRADRQTDTDKTDGWKHAEAFHNGRETTLVFYWSIPACLSVL